MLLILPIFLGLAGVLYAGPVADLIAMVIALVVVRPDPWDHANRHNGELVYDDRAMEPLRDTIGRESDLP